MKINNTGAIAGLNAVCVSLPVQRQTLLLRCHGTLTRAYYIYTIIIISIQTKTACIPLLQALLTCLYKCNYMSE